MHTLRVYLQLLSMNFKVLLIYKASFVISLVLTTIWILSYFALIEVIFLHTDTLAGWSKGHVLLVMAFYYTFRTLADIFFNDNFEKFDSIVRRGELDLRITKPVSTRVMAFLYEARFDNLAGAATTAAAFFYAFANLDTPPHVSSVLLGFVMVILSTVLYFNTVSIINTLAFRLGKTASLNVLTWNLSQVARYPRQIYGKVMGFIFSFVLPLALLASIPAEVSVSANSASIVAAYAAINLVFFLIAKLYFESAIRHYTSAN